MTFNEIYNKSCEHPQAFWGQVAEDIFWYKKWDKGVVRDTGGGIVSLKWSMKNVYNVQPGDVYWAASDLVGIEQFPVKDGSVARPLPGWILQVLEDAGNEVKSGEIRALVVKFPLPPGTFPELWNVRQLMIWRFLMRLPRHCSLWGMHNYTVKHRVNLCMIIGVATLSYLLWRSNPPDKGASSNSPLTRGARGGILQTIILASRMINNRHSNPLNPPPIFALRQLLLYCSTKLHLCSDAKSAYRTSCTYYQGDLFFHWGIPLFLYFELCKGIRVNSLQGTLLSRIFS